MITPLLASLLLAASAGEGAPRRQVKVIVTSPQAPAPSGQSFRATEILEVQFDAQFRQRPTGDHLLEFKVYTPTGKLYQVLPVPFSGRAGPTQFRQVEGFPRAIQERRLREVEPSKFRVNARLPVAGTWIVTNSLYGGWRVDAHFDGNPEPAGSGNFWIQP